MTRTPTARDQILGGIRRALGRGPLAGAAAAGPAERLARHHRNLVPARAQGLDPAGLAALFTRMAEAVSATVEPLTDLGEVPAAIAAYLARHNLPATLAMAPDPMLEGLPWTEAPMIERRVGKAGPLDAVGLTAAVAGVAETGTLMLASGPTAPTTLALLPDTHIVVLTRDQLVASYEDGFDRIRQSRGALPRSINFITGPSRTGDIEQRIQLGAHGPRRLHILLVEQRPPAP